MHTIIVQSALNLVESRLPPGLLTLHDVRAYATELEALFPAGKLKPYYYMLLDVSACTIQPQAILQAFGQHAARCPAARRIAVVTGSSIIRMQVRRAMSNANTRIFHERDEALDWLVRERTAAAA